MVEHSIPALEVVLVFITIYLHIYLFIFIENYPKLRVCIPNFGHSDTLGVFDWSSSVTYVLTDWTCLTILYSSGTGNEAN